MPFLPALILLVIVVLLIVPIPIALHGSSQRAIPIPNMHAPPPPWAQVLNP